MGLGKNKTQRQIFSEITKERCLGTYTKKGVWVWDMMPDVLIDLYNNQHHVSYPEMINTCT